MHRSRGIARFGVLFAVIFSLVSLVGSCKESNNESPQPTPSPTPYTYNPPVGPWYQCSDADEPAGATVITAMNQVDQYFNGDSDNHRSVDAAVTFPSTSSWGLITMRIELGCPADGDCDNWDRLASISIVDNPGTANEVTTELWRYITPYNIGFCMLGDVSGFGSMLTGTRTIRSTIDTWVGPNFQANNGHGWRVTLKFIFHPGTSDRVPDQLINLWPAYDVVVGDPANPISGQIGDRSETLPATVSKAEIRLIVTGHGQGNKDNCAEFCHSSQVILVNGTPFSLDPWRGDCADNPNGPGQAGTWKYQRAGWCPGAAVLPNIFDVTAAVRVGQANTFAYQVWDTAGNLYVNTCRPGAGDESNHCTGCAFNQNPGNCDYNGGNHTQPFDRIAVQLLIWQ